MNTLDDLRSILADRAATAGQVRPDLSGVRARAHRRRRTRQAIGATAAATAVLTGAGSWFVGRTPQHDEVTTADTPAFDDQTMAIRVPLETSRTLDDGAVLTLTATPPRPTYGPYGSDHLAHPAGASVRCSGLR